MREILEYGLMFAGFGLSLLVLVSFWIPGILGWKAKLAELSPLMRELFWTYAGYVWFTNLFMTVLALGFRSSLLAGTPVAAVVCGFVCIWWAVRVWLQFFGFDLKEVEDTRLNRIAKTLLTLLFVYLMIFFAVLVWWNLGGGKF